MFRRTAAALALLYLAPIPACASGTSEPAAAPSAPEPDPADTAPPEPTPSAEAPKPETKRDYEMPAVDFSERDDSVAGWLKANGFPDASPVSLSALAGLPASSNLECDSLVPVGKPFEKAALCRRQVQHGIFELETFFLLLVPEGGKLKTLWQASTAASMIHPNDNSEHPLVQLDVSLQDDGLALFVQDAEGFACDGVRARAATARADAEPEEKAAIGNVERVAASLCRGRGKYTWRNSTFVRTGAVR